MIPRNQPCDAHIHAMAARLARKCRVIVQACLREEEWGEADRCFYEIIRPEIENMLKGEKRCDSCS